MFINDVAYKWDCVSEGGKTLHYKGNKDFAVSVLPHLSGKDVDLDQLTKHFKKIDRYSSGIIETDTHIVGWVDHIRSWPLFYTQKDDTFFISQDSYTIKDHIADTEYNQESLIEFKLSGYVTGKETLINDLFCLNPGEFCLWDKREKTLSVQKYFSYIPSFDSQINKDEAIKQQNKIFDELTLRIIAEADGKPIWIPLSGGLDSRILLCKLHEHGYKNIQTFTYGPRFNFEGLIAKKIAKKLNVPWRFVAVPRKILRSYFDSDNRKNFFKFAGNLKTIPCMREYGAIRYLHENGQIDKDAIFLNGQSGDYITGGHLSKQSKDNPNYDINCFYDVIINKHYDLWKQVKTEENLEIIRKKINKFVANITGQDIRISSPLDGAKYEETWEYDGRQICYVANGQRVYEYFGYNWEMPLWEKSLVDFYQPLSFDMKYGQKIYKDYLHSYNYMGLFPIKEPYIWRWPLPMLWVVPLAQIIGLIGGRKTKDNFYALMRYWGHYANQYAFFDFNYYKKFISKTRNVIALYVLKYLEENNLRL